MVATRLIAYHGESRGIRCWAIHPRILVRWSMCFMKPWTETINMSAQTEKGSVGSTNVHSAFTAASMSVMYKRGVTRLTACRGERKGTFTSPHQKIMPVLN